MDYTSTILNPPEESDFREVASGSPGGTGEALLGGEHAKPAPTDPELEARRIVEANGERLHDQPVFTHATWRAKPGRSNELIAAWNVLGDLFPRLEHPPIDVTLIRRADDPDLFHSIGSWRSLADAQAVSDSPEAIDAVAAIAALCVEGEPAVYEIVRRVRPK